METLTVNHLASNGIVPEDITIVYPVVEIAGKLWLGQNLGATRQPLSLTDTSDESRGLLFQFNRKKGYDFKNGVRTPDTAPDRLIMEDCGWLPENDPCIELGEGWHMPTKQEWDDYRKTILVGRSQSAYYWRKSPLKLHQGGFFYTYSLDKMYSQGLTGMYWTSEKGPFPEETAMMFKFSSSNVQTSWMNKYYGLSIRAVKDI